MADTFVECLVARPVPAYAPIVKWGSLAMMILCIFLGLLAPIVLIGAVLNAIVFFAIAPRMCTEFEYAFVGDQLRVDRIINRASRKKAGEYEMSRVDLVAPENSSEMHAFLQNPHNKGKVIDYTSRTADANVYGMLYNGNNGKIAILIEPNEKLIKAMKYQSPRKVIEA